MSILWFLNPDSVTSGLPNAEEGTKSAPESRTSTLTGRPPSRA